jgi:subtilase family serine protease
VRRRRNRPTLEALEARELLTVAYPAALVLHPGTLVPASVNGLPAGLSPTQVRHAYGFDQIAFSNGVRGNGSGQTIAIVDAYDQPNLASNLATFDATYGIAAPPGFTKMNQAGGSSLPAASGSWGLEESLDVEWAHAIAPGAKIVLVEANSASLTDLLAAVNTARNLPGVSVVSMSWGAGEFSGESSYDRYFTTPAGHTGVTFVASSGDSGSSGAPEWPSIASTVLAVGGTQLSVGAAGNYLGETGWSGSGGGISAFESQPSYQKGVVTQSATKRTVPDVAYDGSGGSPFAVYDSYAYGGWIEVYGTSAGAPQWSALVAIADQGRALAGKGALDGPTQTLPALYRLPSADFHDVTSGSNGGYSAGAGYDLVAGRGSPVANLIVSGLVGNSAAPPAPTPPTVVVPAHASANPVTGTSTALGVSGSDAAGAAGLTYTWSVIASPANVLAPGLGANGTNAAQNTTVVFHGAGSYSFLVTLKDAAGLTATSSLTLTVSQTVTYLTLFPGSVSLTDGHAQQFAGRALDQFGNAMSTQPKWTWSVSAGAGTITANGLYTAPASGSGSTTVRASALGLSLFATVQYKSATPAVPTNVTARAVARGWVLVTWSAGSTGQSGFLIERSTNGGAWTVVGAVAANVSFFDDMRAASGNTYAYRVAAYNGVGASSYSAPTAGVRPLAATVGHALAGLSAGTGTGAASPTAAATGSAATSASYFAPPLQPAVSASGASEAGQGHTPRSSSPSGDIFWTSAGGEGWLDGF